jgi:DNA (cytosine-5)-methyltransferase 1
MRVGSLFSGIGGIEIGFDAEGFDTVWFVENDRYAQAVLRKHWPHATVYGDITQLDFRVLPKVDILTGGFPCQDISNAGKRVGIEGSRSSLWKYYLEAIRILRPRYVLIENVSAILGRGLDVVLGDLAQIGYDAEWHCVPAVAVGANHRRDRLFIIAYPNIRQRQDEQIPTGRDTSAPGVDDVADTEMLGCVHGQTQQRPGERGINALSDLGPGSKTVADSPGNKPSGICRETESLDGERNTRLESQCSGDRQFDDQTQDVGNTKQKGLEGHDDRQGPTVEAERIGTNTGPTNIGYWSLSWAVESPVGRVADGISHRVDRIKCLGNAVVPQCAQIFAKAIKLKEDIDANR